MQDVNGVSIEIIKDYNSSLNQWLSDNGLVTKNGSVFKNVSVVDGDLFVSRATMPIKAKRVTGKNKDSWLLVDHDFYYDGSATGLLNLFKSLGDLNIKIDGKMFNGPFKELNQTVITDDNNLNINVGEKPNTFNKKEMDRFIQLLFSDKGVSVMPLMYKFIKVIKQFPVRKHDLTGYVSIPKWLHSIKQGNLLPSLGKNASIHNGIWLNIARGNVKAIPIEYNNRLEWNISGTIESINGNPLPYLLIQTKPIQKSGFPTIPMRLMGESYFINPIIFNDPSSLGTLKGGFDLLN